MGAQFHWARSGIERHGLSLKKKTKSRVYTTPERSAPERELWPCPARIAALVLAILGALLWPIIAFR